MPQAQRKQARQLSLIPHRRRQAHGGELSRGRRKLYRPLDCKKSLHVVLRSTKAKGYRSLNNNSKLVRSVVAKSARHFGVKVYRFALNHNHLHLSVYGKRRIDIQNFFRVLAGHIAQQILRKYPIPNPRGNAPPESRKSTVKSKYKRKFWDDLIYSRLVTWGREFKTVLQYLEKNRLEALGLLCRWQKSINEQQTSTRRASSA